jgi:hypothetical protein
LTCLSDESGAPSAALPEEASSSSGSGLYLLGLGLLEVVDDF